MCQPLPSAADSPSVWLAGLASLFVLAAGLPLVLRFGPAEAFRLAVFSLLPALTLLAVMEGGLRLVTGAPRGLFAGLCRSGDVGLYPPNQRILVPFGHRDYEVETNSHGLRGREVPLGRTPGAARLVALGDSFTEGFYVANHETYPHQLEDILGQEHGLRAEVVNLARGGATITHEMGNLIRHGLKFQPDLVLLQFCDNDIEHLKVFRRENFSLEKAASWGRVADYTGHVSTDRLQCFLARTALGEAVMDLHLKWRHRLYRGQARGAAGQEPRYLEPGEVAATWLGKKREERAGRHNVLYEPFTPEIEQWIGDYLFYLERLAEVCRRNGVGLVFLFLPAPQQVYDPESSLRVRDLLAAACHRLGAAFIDATPEFKRLAREENIYFAPYDFHLNARGNRFLAAHVAAELVGRGLLGEAPAR